ncbi:triphosphoribosyl-dephospho-CoA synthase [Trichloromonas sp.]|uniref:triphosphoribosyl-dephospho-CoA synthase n=1 Tax=Trichloromonas sp. TaxID=3069249 RepID=UPI003D8174C2
MNCCNRSATEALAAALLQGLTAELYLTPKPGLVDLWDNGSHADLSLPKMVASIELIGVYFDELTAALAAGAASNELIGLGRIAEERMLARLATNTHKGAIFLGGLLLTASARATDDQPETLRLAVAAVATEIIALRTPAASNGAAARQTYRVGGILAEASAGLPCLFDIALPAWHASITRRADPQRAAFSMLAALMQKVEDTTALHRCGTAGLERLRRDGRMLELLLARDEDPVPLLQQLNLEYRRSNLTMGGVADLLGLAFGYLDFLGEPVRISAEQAATLDSR